MSSSMTAPSPRVKGWNEPAEERWWAGIKLPLAAATFVLFQEVSAVFFENHFLLLEIRRRVNLVSSLWPSAYFAHPVCENRLGTTGLDMQKVLSTFLQVAGDCYQCVFSLPPLTPPSHGRQLPLLNLFPPLFPVRKEFFLLAVAKCLVTGSRLIVGVFPALL